ncbi:hypothetical protein H310_00617 [Aphanomyces invadans]|uniref:Uncharacterized protein n=1 Tax=Aphanomyces invadans TaxID=157072 RepID=A0A024UX64_9STRA|nr:hypothetical protein H310_00617 [Aphanomyces invadans]ETW10268.1 hypothetical protein H310_00617 [Aphanomyces invadans]|eukprot:XP_008861679.1 hypothetical protein H310_00617 [Aphanomyces invadans]
MDIARADAVLPAEIRDIPRAKEIVDMMKFFEFSFQPASAFEGTICFTFKVENSTQTMRYLVRCKKHQGVKTHLVDPTSTDLKYDCEVRSSIEDFLHVYSGKASTSEMAKMCYSGRVSISGLQFRLVTRFLQSFDFTSQKWLDFYSWEREQRQRQGRTAQRENDEVVDHLPRQIALYIRGGGVNMSMVQRGCFEASMGRIFGSRVLMTYTALVHQGRRLPTTTDRLQFKNKKFGRAVRCALGHHCVSSKKPYGSALHATTNGRTDVLMLWEDSYELVKFEGIVPSSNASATLLKWSDSALYSGCASDMAAGVEDGAQVPTKSRHRFPAETFTRRVDLRDVGMTQLSKIMDNVVGTAFQPAAKSNHISAPARIMGELRKWVLHQAHDHHQPSVKQPTDLHSVLRDIDVLISTQLGKPTRPAPSLQKEVPTADIIRYNTRRDLARIKQTMAGMKRNLLAHQISPRSMPDNMGLLTLDY